MPLTIKPSSGSGSVTISATTGTTTNDTLTLPAKTGNIITSADSGTVTQTMLSTNVAGNGPAFSAYSTVSPSFSAASYNKILFQTKEYDTATCYDTSTSRFTPTVAGYYYLTSGVLVQNGSRGGEIQIFIYKNGSVYKSGLDIIATSTLVSTVCVQVYANGTDYFEVYLYTQNAGSGSTNGSTNQYFQGFMARAA